MTMAVEVSTKPVPAISEGDERVAEAQSPTVQSSSMQTRDLGEAEAEDVAAHRPEPRGLHLEADDEEEHHDAELGDVQDRLRIVEEPEAERADREARREVAEHRAEAEPLEERHRDDRRGEQHDDRHDVEAVAGSHRGGVPGGFGGAFPRHLVSRWSSSRRQARRHSFRLVAEGVRGGRTTARQARARRRVNLWPQYRRPWMDTGAIPASRRARRKNIVVSIMVTSRHSSITALEAARVVATRALARRALMPRSR